MLNFKKTNIVFSVIFFIIILMRIYIPFSNIWFFFLFFIYALILFFGSKNICSQFYIDVKCRYENKNMVYLTFDDGPDKKITPQILKILKKHNVKSTFFCIGKKAETYPNILKQIAEEGHAVGNHSYSHSLYFDFFGTTKVLKELEKTNQLIKQITGEECKVFRPPYGVTNPNIARAVKKTKMQVFGWNIRSLDTVKNKKQIMKRLQKVQNGDIILFHDTKEQTVEILDEFLSSYKQFK